MGDGIFKLDKYMSQNQIMSQEETSSNREAVPRNLGTIRIDELRNNHKAKTNACGGRETDRALGSERPSSEGDD